MKAAPILVTTLVASAFFMENLDGTIIATALPQMALSFHVGVVKLNIGMTAYMVTLAVFIPISGWAADRFGSRSIFASAVGLFTLSSGLCGLSRTLTEFTLMRILQGLGGAMMVPVGRLIVLRNAPKEELTQAINYITWPGLTALVLGPPLGGFITTYSNWRWIFFLNLPIGTLAFLLALLWIKNFKDEKRQPFDWLTFLLAGFASSGIVYGLEKLGNGGNLWQLPAAILTMSLLAAVLAVLAARLRPEVSFVDLESMKFKSYSLSIYGASMFRIAIVVLPFLLPLMFQIIFGLSAFQSGLYLLALFAGDLIMKAFVIQSLRRFGFRRIIMVNAIISMVSIALCAVLSPTTPGLVILIILAFHGICRSMEFTCMTTLAYVEIPPAKLGRANGFLSAIQQLCSGMGIALGAITLRLVARARGHSAATLQLWDFRLAILFLAILALGPLFGSLGLSEDAGATTSGHGQPQPGFDLT